MSSYQQGWVGISFRLPIAGANSLKDAMPLFDILMRTGDTVNGYPADVAAKTVRESVGILSRIFGV